MKHNFTNHYQIRKPKWESGTIVPHIIEFPFGWIGIEPTVGGFHIVGNTKAYAYVRLMPEIYNTLGEAKTVAETIYCERIAELLTPIFLFGEPTKSEANRSES